MSTPINPTLPQTLDLTTHTPCNWIQIALLVSTLVFGALAIFGGIELFAPIGTISHTGSLTLFTLGTLFMIASAIAFVAIRKKASPQPAEVVPAPAIDLLPHTEATARESFFEADAPPCTELVHFSFIDAEETRKEAKKKVVSYLTDPCSISLTDREKSAIGVMLGMACGDSIGAPFEALPFKKEGYRDRPEPIRFGLKEGSGQMILRWDSAWQIT